MLRSWALVQAPVVLRTSGPAARQQQPCRGPTEASQSNTGQLAMLCTPGPAARQQELCTVTAQNKAEQHPSAAATYRHPRRQ